MSTKGFSFRQYVRLYLASSVQRAFVFLLLIGGTQIGNAQCAMCRAVLESEGNVEVAEGINNGIVYLMAIPYLLVAVLFYFVYQKMKN